MKALLRALPLILLPLSALGFLCLPVLPEPAGPYSGTAPAGSFNPVVSVTVDPATAGSQADLTFTLSIPSGDLLPVGAAILLPSEWGVAADVDVTDGLEVGNVTGTFTASNDLLPLSGCTQEADFQTPLVDATTNTANITYPAFLNSIAPGTHKARYYGEADVEGLAVVPINILVDGVGSGEDRLVVIVGDPTTAPSFGAELMCSPWNFTLTLCGYAAAAGCASATSGEDVYTNPPQGSYTFRAVIASEWDQDNDGEGNALDNCPINQSNPPQTDADNDRLGLGCDPNDGLADVDIDGDSVPNGFDNCAFDPNAGQEDADFDDLGDACDTTANGTLGPDTPDGTRYVLECTQNVFIDVVGSDTATCGDLQEPVATATATPVAVGGAAELPDLDESLLPVPDSSGGDAGFLAGISAAVTAAVVALASAVWHVKRRRLGRK